MIEIPAKAHVSCLDGHGGHPTHIIADPVSQQITHLVVKCNWPPFSEVIVPIEQVERTEQDQVWLKCTREELSAMPPFEEEVFIRMTPPSVEDGRMDYLAWPYGAGMPGFFPDEMNKFVPVKRENIPDGEFAVQRGARVEATDGFVGYVDDLLVNSTNMQIAYLVLKERHLLSHREVTIPVSQIKDVNEDTIYLKLDRKSIDALPTVPLQHAAH